MSQQPAPTADDHAWAAFEAEALPHVDRLFRLALWFERNRHEAEDLVQETMMQALQSFHRFQPGTNCRAWLTKDLKNAIDWVIGSGELEGKVVAITAAVPAPERGRRGLQALRDTLSAVRVTIIGGEPIPAGPTRDRDVAQLVRALIAAVAAAHRESSA